MPDPIEFNPVDTISAGALGRPGQRRFMIQARSNGALLCILMEKQQISQLAEEANDFLDRIGDADSDTEAEPRLDSVNDALCGQVIETEPLFRASLIGIGYDPHRQLVLLELREFPQTEDDVDDEPSNIDEPEGFIARLYASRAQVRAMLRHGVASVGQGRPPCPLCQFPMDPDGHPCPRWN